MHKKLLKEISAKLDALKSFRNDKTIDHAARHFYSSSYTDAEKELAHVNRLLPSVEQTKQVHAYQKSISIGHKRFKV